MTGLWIWFTAAVIYLAFRAWYDNWRGPLRAEEMDRYLERIRVSELTDTSDLDSLRRFMEEDDGRLIFDGPLPLPTWQLRGALEKEKRVHRVTRTELVSGGITSFCWLAPGEKDPGSERATLRLIPAARSRPSLAAIGPRAERCGARVARWCPRHL